MATVWCLAKGGRAVLLAPGDCLLLGDRSGNLRQRDLPLDGPPDQDIRLVVMGASLRPELHHLAQDFPRGTRLYLLLRDSGECRLFAAEGELDLVGGQFGPLNPLPYGSPVPDELRAVLPPEW